MDLIIGIVTIGLLGAVLGTLLGWASKALSVEGDPRVEEISDLLPGGQCGQCGVAGCAQAAQAMVEGSLSADSCPPGGRSLALTIAGILGVSLGEAGDDTSYVAVIDESQCSGCMRCYKVCPFDAIVGANRQMHTVISHICTGCKLCEKACSQGCLSMEPVSTGLNTWQWPKPKQA
ncbi:MAG: RnfABCDGE type electron transport complex subunit B [Colwellia sp.]